MSERLDPRSAKCPKCREPRLRRLADGHAFTCSRCRGLWIELADLDANEISLPRLESPPLHDTQADSRAGICPKGHGLLIRAKPDVEPGFFLDRCMKCGGIWFDQGEWEILAAASLVTDLPVLWDLSYQRRRRHEDSEKRFRRTLETNLGDDLLEDLERLATQLADHPYRNQALAHLRHLLGKSRELE